MNGTKCAIKVIDKHYIMEKTSRLDDLMKELYILENHKHDHIVETYELL